MAERYIELPAEERARRYVDYLVKYEVIAYETDEAYEDAVVKLTEQFEGKA